MKSDLAIDHILGDLSPVAIPEATNESTSFTTNGSAVYLAVR